MSDPNDYKPDDYTVGWICALPTEGVAAQTFLDEKHQGPRFQTANDTNNYTFGRIGAHNVVIAVLPMGEYGTASASSVASHMMRSFPNVRIGLMVGIGGGAPSPTNDIRLGDVVVSVPTGGQGGVFQYDFGKSIQERSFQHTRALNQPPQVLLAAVSSLQMDHEMEGNRLQDEVNRALEKHKRLKKKYGRPQESTDILFQPGIVHLGDSCDSCRADPANVMNREPRTEDDDDPQVHYGTIASANTLMKDALMRDLLASQNDVLCFEMEAAGLMNRFPCLVIRGICDYSDSHKNKAWQGFAAMVAAAYAKQIIGSISPQCVQQEKKLSEIYAQTSNIERIVQDVQCQQHEDRERQALDWLSGIDFGLQHTDILSRRQPGTCQWLLDSQEYQHWVQEKNQVLFCPGIPGAGKTILASVVIEDLHTRFQHDPSVQVSHIYCNFKRQSSQTVNALLASILRQLCQNQFPLPEPVVAIWNKHKERRTKAQPDEISSTLKSVASLFSRLFLIVDALDEWRATKHEQVHLLDDLLCLQQEIGLNLFATSRLVPIVEDRLRHYPTIDITAHHEDICEYIDGQRWRLPNFVTSNLELQQYIKTSISKAAQGMFLLAQLYLKSIETKTSIRDLKEALELLQLRAKQRAHDPNVDTLSEAYDDTMERMNQQNPDHKRLALRVLSWICCASRELATVELQHALALRDGDTEIHADGVPEVDLLISVCFGLVVVDEARRRIRLVHYTTHDYFKHTQDRWFPEAQAYIAKQCINYLSLPEFEDESGKDSPYEFNDRLRRYFSRGSLYDYAATNWGYHTLQVRIPTDEVDEAAICFLNKPKSVSAATKVLDQRPRIRSHFDKEEDQIVRINGLHLAAMIGLDRVLPSLFERYGINSTDSVGGTALSWAVNHGHMDSVKMLLQGGADTKSRCNSGFTALSEAIRGNHLVITRILLDSGADANWPDSNGQTPMLLAAKYGSRDIAQLLLDNGALFNKLDTYSTTPLVTAVRCRNHPVYELLFEYGAEVDSCGQNRRTALLEASRRGDESVVKMLLDKGADPNWNDNNKRTALMEASSGGHQDTVRLLLDKCVDPNWNDKNKRTALMEASSGGHQDTVRLLLAKDADPNWGDKKERTALMEASAHGHLGTVKVLLENAADPNRTDFEHGTALGEAIMRGHHDVAELLLHKRADPNLNGGWCVSTIYLAVRGEHERIDQLLLNHGADPRLKMNPNRDLLLHTAIEKGQQTVIRLLLAANADFEQQDREGRTAIHVAAINGNEWLIRWLIDKGVDIHRPDRHGITPLLHAMRKNHKSVARLLKENGASWYRDIGMREPKSRRTSSPDSS